VELFRSISSYPSAGLIQDKAGNLYGTTQSGGAHNAGNVFSLTTNGTITSVYDFTGGSDGGAPVSDLISDAKGNLYGTAQSGGGGDGVVFKLAPDGTETILHAFSGDEDGKGPTAGLVMDRKGNFYGTTPLGGLCSVDAGCGTVFKLTPNGVETILHKFSCFDDGCYPAAGVILDRKGNLYGTTASNNGNVFEITASGAFQVLHRFGGNGDGNQALGRLVRDDDGNLYGTTEIGGTGGSGTVFRLAPNGTETILHSFAGTDGSIPGAGLIRDSKGNLYGTAANGGAGCGTVFKLSPHGQESTLHSFFPNPYVDGCRPLGGLLLTKNGNLYGTTYLGGTANTGTVFVVTP